MSDGKFQEGGLDYFTQGKGVFRYFHNEFKERGANTFSLDIRGGMDFFTTISKMPYFRNS